MQFAVTISELNAEQVTSLTKFALSEIGNSADVKTTGEAPKPARQTRTAAPAAKAETTAAPKVGATGGGFPYTAVQAATIKLHKTPGQGKDAVLAVLAEFGIIGPEANAKLLKEDQYGDYISAVEAVLSGDASLA